LLSPADFFDLADCPFPELLKDIKYVWEMVPRIARFLENWERWEIKGKVMDGAFVKGKVFIGSDAVVEPGAYVIGPVVIGSRTVVRHGAYIRGNVVAGSGCIIGHTTEVKNSIFLDGAKAAHFAYVGDSILGRNVNLGAGTKLANSKIQAGREKIVIRAEGKKYPTGLRKLGAILGDGVELGCNCVTAPGTLIGPHTLVYPCTSLRGVIPPNSIVKTKQSLQIVEREDY